jgi:hypothetical protein
MGGFVALNTLVVIASLLLDQPFTARYREEIWPVIFPAAALVAMGATVLRRLTLSPAEPTAPVR